MSDLDPKRPGTPGSQSKYLIPLALFLVAGIGFLTWKSDRNHPDSASAGSSTSTLTGANSFSESQTRNIEDIVRSYLTKHPEILLEMQSALEAKMAKEEADKTRAMVKDNAKDIYRHPNAAVAGNPNGDITVVEFFDYNCGYCKRGFPQIAKLIESDKNVRVVMKELPIIRDESEPVSRIALAARLQGKYWELHSQLITLKGMVNETEALKAAEKLGLDIPKLKADMNSSEVKDELNRVKALAQKMGINGTPHFLVGDKAIGGAPENLQEMLAAHIAELRKTGCSYC